MIDVCDFFSGCGGASKGFQDSGFNILLGIDINGTAANTFKSNFPQANFINKDIREITFLETDKIIERRKGRRLLFCGCAPCQPFSKQNRQKKENDNRIHLLIEFQRFVEHYLPDYVFVENVPGMQTFKIEGSPLEMFLSALKENGYQYECKVISAADYGVPQPRKRLIVMASLHRKPVWPATTNGKGKAPYSTVGEWIKGLKPLNAGEVDENDPDHCAAKLSSVNLERIKKTPMGGGRECWPEHLKLNCHKKHSGHTDVYGRLSYDKMSVTLTTRCTSYSNGRYGHPEQNRALTIREAACLQTFPKDFKFEGNFVEKAMQVGNAVPPLLAQKLAEAFLKIDKDTFQDAAE